MKQLLLTLALFVACGCSKPPAAPAVRDVEKDYSAANDVTTFTTRSVSISHPKYQIGFSASVSFKGTEHPEKVDPPEITITQTPSGAGGDRKSVV